MSDTPISNSTPHNVAELGMLCRRLERELNTASLEIEEKRKDIIYLATEKAKLENRIQRLEELGDELHDGWRGNRNNMDRYLEAWTKAKEANSENERLTNKVAQLRKGAEEQQRIKRLEKDSKRLAWLLETGLAWRGCYNDYWIKGEWLYSSQYAIATIDKARKAKL